MPIEPFFDCDNDYKSFSAINRVQQEAIHLGATFKIPQGSDNSWISKEAVKHIAELLANGLFKCYTEGKLKPFSLNVGVDVSIDVGSPFIENLCASLRIAPLVHPVASLASVEAWGAFHHHFEKVLSMGKAGISNKELSALLDVPDCVTYTKQEGPGYFAKSSNGNPEVAFVNMLAPLIEAALINARTKPFMFSFSVISLAAVSSAGSINLCVVRPLQGVFYTANENIKRYAMCFTDLGLASDRVVVTPWTPKIKALAVLKSLKEIRDALKEDV